MALSAAKKIIKNSLSVITGNLLNKMISIVLLVYLTGYLGPASFGKYTFVVAYTAFFGIFTDLGLNTFMTREISAGSIEPGRGFAHSIIIRFIATTVTVIIMFLSLVLLGYPDDILWLAAASALSLFVSFRGLFFRTVFDIPFQVALKMNWTASVNFVNELIILCVVLLLIFSGVSLFGIMLGMAAANLPGFIVMMFLSTRLLKPRFSFDPAVWRNLLKAALPLGIAIFFEGLFIIIPFFFLSMLSTDEAVGFYGLPFRLVSSLWIMPVAVMISLLPRMSRDAVVSELSVTHGFFSGLKVILLAGVPIALTTAYFSETIINVLAGEGYKAAAPILSIMIWGTFMYFINTVFFYTFTAAGRQRVNTVVWGIISALSAVLCVVLIPRFSQTGAALAFVIPLGAGVVVNIIFANMFLKINIVPVLSRFLLSGVLAFIVISLSHLNTLPSLTLGLGVYVVTLLYQRTISYKEWEEWLGAGEAESR